MLGLGAPGVWFALADRPQRFQPACLLASGIAVPLSVVVVVRHGAQLLEASMLWVILCLLPAMLALGAVVCLQLMRARGAAVSRMYGIEFSSMCAYSGFRLGVASRLGPLARARTGSERTRSKAATLKRKPLLLRHSSHESLRKGGTCEV